MHPGVPVLQRWQPLQPGLSHCTRALAGGCFQVLQSGRRPVEYASRRRDALACQACMQTSSGRGLAPGAPPQLTFLQVPPMSLLMYQSCGKGGRVHGYEYGTQMLGYLGGGQQQRCNSRPHRVGHPGLALVLNLPCLQCLAPATQRRPSSPRALMQRVHHWPPWHSGPSMACVHGLQVPQPGREHCTAGHAIAGAGGQGVLAGSQEGPRAGCKAGTEHQRGRS